jgi:ferredoxin
MGIFISSKIDFRSSVQKMIQYNVVYGVKRKTPGFAFAQLFGSEELCLDYDITVLPPNRYLLPPSESLLRFNLVPEVSVHSSAEFQASIILGIHPYDLHAIRLLDAVFTGSLVDLNYQARRSATAIIGVDCLNPWPYSFAASMGTALPPRIFDLWLTDLGDEYLIEIGSSKGESLLKRYFMTRDASEAQLRQRDKLRQESLTKYQLSLAMSPQEIPEILDKGWNSPMWEELGQKCFACGSCTMVCPTCVCFDVRDKIGLNLREGERYRSWDSCMFDNFDKMASGENFRPTGTDRLRHRLHRKGKYMLERWGELGCVGCGRCVHACLVDIANPVYAYNRLAREVK